MKPKIVIIMLSLFLGFCSMHAMGQNAHFWDGIEAFDGPTDENPVLAAQLDFYFDKMVAPLPDSITPEIDRLVERNTGKKLKALSEPSLIVYWKFGNWFIRLWCESITPLGVPVVPEV